ncbi:MAG: hydantoinase/oxoprolinase family protein [Chloroflexi bacterium]|nr:hydantoinase/oxoprolinase family protein [Chloroflexota bacterium]
MTTILGVDVGGTFTDFLLWQDGELSIYKRPSTPDDPSRGVLAGLDEAGFSPDEVVHGSTVATNAVLERKGARTALITTKGFRDVLAIGRQTRPKLYDLEPRRPPPLIPDALRLEANERLDHHGNALQKLSRRDVDALLDRLVKGGVRSLAVCFLFSFLNPAHERMVLDAARKRGIACSASFEVLPEHREYERTSTTVLNAYVAPVIERYLSKLSSGLKSRKAGKLRIMQSNGGSARAEIAASLAVRTVLSGPAGGVAGAFQVAASAGFDRIITFDMGGTSTDVCLCDGSIPLTSESMIDGMPLRIPTVDVHTVGAGGGSIARIDAGGALRVGPESAGADPGPACYGNGTEPTVTDAHLVLGRLRADRFLGGRMQLSIGAAERAVRTIARAYGGDLRQAAASVIRVADASMERALRVASVERGHDPRRFTLVAFGGAGPLHACQLAESLGIPRVLVPLFPGVLSAFGMAAAPITTDHVQALLATVDEGAALERRLGRVLDKLESRARRELASQGYKQRVRILRSLDLRYAGQSYELTVPISTTKAATYARAFHTAHKRRYGHSDPSRAVEVVSARVRAQAPGAPVRMQALPRRRSGMQAARIERVPVRFERERQTWMYERERLRAGDRLRGPALVLQLDSTTVIPPGWQGRVDRIGNLVLEVGR